MEQIDWHERVETALVSSLDTNRSQAVVSLTPQAGTWDSDNFWFGVANDEKDFYFQRIQALFKLFVFNKLLCNEGETRCLIG